MHKALKIAAWTIGGLVVLVGAAALYAQIGSERRMNRIVSLTPSPVAIPSDAEALARGKYLYDSRGCIDCHARDGAGRTLVDDGALVIRGPNLTAGKAGIASGYSDLDWVRAIRHGVGPQGKPLLIMPSEDYARLSDEDLGSMIAYIRSLPPVDGEPRELRLPLPVRFAYAVGIIKDASEKIDHAYKPAPPQDDVIAQGEYVANMCMGCHGLSFTGGKIPGGPPDWPAAANLTPVAGGAMARYPDVASFSAMLRSGKRPDGTGIAVMPFESLSELDDGEVAAMYAYFRSLSPAGK